MHSVAFIAITLFYLFLGKLLLYTTDRQKTNNIEIREICFGGITFLLRKRLLRSVMYFREVFMKLNGNCRELRGYGRTVLRFANVRATDLEPLYLTIFLLFAFIVSGCPDFDDVGDGGRFGYHSPEPDDEYLRDNQLEIAREYWRVFVQPSGTAYVMPRPDGAAPLILACHDENHALNDVLNTYTLCDDSPDIARVNAMEPNDALAITRYLHKYLVFESRETGLSYYAFPDDILEACEQDSEFANGPLKERCDFEKKAKKTGSRSEIGWSHTGAEGEALAAKMNELYGLNVSLCERLEQSAFLQVEIAILTANSTCTTDDECTVLERISDCHDSCEAPGALSAKASVSEASDTASNTTCVAYQRANCPAVIHPPCIGIQARCIDGMCRE